MLTDRYDPIDLFAMVPQLSLQMEPALAQLDRLLEDDELFQYVKADLAKRHPQTLVRGRHSTPVEVILRMLVVKRLYGWSYEETEYFVTDSLVLRQFCRLGSHAPPDDTTLIRWAQQIAPESVAKVNARVVELAAALKVTRGRKLRIDTTATETNIHHPTDGSLLADGVRVLSRLLRRTKAAVGGVSEHGARAFEGHTRSARKWVRVIHGWARRMKEATREQPAKGKGKAPKPTGEEAPKGGPQARRERPKPEAKSAPQAKGKPAGGGGGARETPPEKKRRAAQEGLQNAYRHLIGVTKQSVAQAKQACGVLQACGGAEAERLQEKIEQFVPRVEQAIQQAQQRVLEGGAVPAKEKVVSLFEPHTQIVVRGKPGRQVEFGRKVLLEEVEGGIVSGYAVLKQVGSDAPYLGESLQRHQERFGKAPELLAADRGFWSEENEAKAKAAGVKRVVIPYAGKAPPERLKHEKARWFRRGYRFRAGSEGRISVLKRRFGLDRCRDHGEAGMERWVGWGVVTSNLAQIARATAAQGA
jgi:transposase, IS5 family